MKAIIENSVIFLNDDEKNHNMLCQFNGILQEITLSKNKEELENRMNKCSVMAFRYFIYGFGGNHFWVKQRHILGEVHVGDERIIFVEF